VGSQENKMALKAVLKTQQELDSVEESLREHYVEKDGVWVLAVDKVGSIELTDTGALRKSLASERDSRKTAEASLRNFEGIDVEAAREAMAKMSEIDSWDPDEKLAEHKAAFEKQLLDKMSSQERALAKKHSEEVERLSGRVGARTEQLKNELIRSRVRKAIVDAGGRLEYLEPIVMQSVQAYEQDDDTIGVRVVGPDGHPMMTRQPLSQDEMAIDEFVPLFQETHPLAFNATNASGSGSSGSSGGTATKGGMFRPADLQSQEAFEAKLSEVESVGGRISFKE
jgi:hypothetical protein